MTFCLKSAQFVDEIQQKHSNFKNIPTFTYLPGHWQQYSAPAKWKFTIKSPQLMLGTSDGQSWQDDSPWINLDPNPVGPEASWACQNWKEDHVGSTNLCQPCLELWAHRKLDIEMILECHESSQWHRLKWGSHQHWTISLKKG